MSIERQWFGLVSYGTNNHQLYAMGGWNGRDGMNSVETYDTQTNKWKPMSVSMNLKRGNFGVAVINDSIYVCGGHQANSGSILNQCEYYSANKWLFTTSMIECRRGLALVAHCGYLYAIGGGSRIDGGYMNSMEKYDILAKRWSATNLTNMHSTRYQFGAASFLGNIYVCGGAGNSNGKTCETYDPRANQWTPIASMNIKRLNFKLIVFQNKLYALGGDTSDGITNTVEIYDENQNQWHYTNITLPYKLDSYGAAVIT
ncbi:kelch-like protein 20 [Oppia nitens]|uniref:kelch-like protein 20 n=1 Tax=Oppia nitens TaxID=1686743 RepID=UPI0023DC610B|nr:kelch-like protein 20 [Oppia nitens]